MRINRAQTSYSERLERPEDQQRGRPRLSRQHTRLLFRLPDLSGLIQGRSPWQFGETTNVDANAITGKD
jgi:hypothetical protein